jgi:hypothetical protein
MFEFRLLGEAPLTVLHVSSASLGDDDHDVLKSVLALIEPSEHLILDLGDLEDLSGGCAAVVHDALVGRAARAESVVVARQQEVSMQLVLHDIDRICPIVRSVDAATGILARS